MNKFHWFESKQLDRVTNYSTEVEPIKYALANNIKAYYYCTFAKSKKKFGLDGHVIYLGFFRNKYLKIIEFQFRVLIKSIHIVLTERNSLIMVNQNLIWNVIPSLFISRLLKRNNKFISDIRTTPVETTRLNANMKSFHKQFWPAVKYFDGFSFITPFMESYIMREYNLKEYKSVNWSSGVDVNLFNPELYEKSMVRDCIRLLYHGGISISRGNLNLIKAAQKLVEEGYKLELIQVGITVDKEIYQYIEDNNISNWCKLLPPVELDKIPQIIADCELPIMPFPNYLAWRVSSPIKLMEYMAMGKKVLVPDIEAFSDVFGTESEFVFYYKKDTNDDVEEIEKAIKKIIDERKVHNGNFNLDVRHFVSENYTWDKQASNLFNFASSLWGN